MSNPYSFSDLMYENKPDNIQSAGLHMITPENANILNEFATNIRDFFTSYTINGNLTINGDIVCEELVSSLLKTINFSNGNITENVTSNIPTNTVINGISQTAISAQSANYAETSGNSNSAVKLFTKRSIGGVDFDGTQDINLPGVNESGNQDTSGTAELARRINTTTNGIVKTTGSDGTLSVGSLTANDIPGNIAANTSGTANMSTKILIRYGEFQEVNNVLQVKFDGGNFVNVENGMCIFDEINNRLCLVYENKLYKLEEVSI